MATALRVFTAHKDIPVISDMRVGIVVAEWNEDITNSLFEGALSTLKKHGINDDNIVTYLVPGTVELTLGAQLIAENCEVDAVICLGCVIKGETPHFDYVCMSATKGITELNIKYGIPFIFGVLTTNTLDQAQARSGGSLGNKGDDTAIAAIRMVAMSRDLINFKK